MTERRTGKRTKGIADDPPAEPDEGDASKPPVEDGLTERKLSGRVELGPISIDVPPEWRFYPLDDRLACRPMSGVGVLQITPVAHDQLPDNPTHEMLMHAAKEASGYDLEGPGFDKAKEQIAGGIAGGESFRAGRDYVRVWYHQRPEGLVFAWFAVPKRRIAERSVARLIGQSDRIIASLRLPPTMDA